MLYIVATPLGNLSDITNRAIHILQNVDLVVAEDTRRTLKLLNSYQISKPIISFHKFSSDAKIVKIIAYLKQEKKIAFLTDAGTPSISDPGAKLVKEVYKQLTSTAIIPIPGPSAVTAALSVSGFYADRFCFFGYAPKKKKRRNFFEEIAQTAYTSVFFSAPHSIIKDLAFLAQFQIKNREIFIVREMTKKFETIYRGTVNNVLELIKKDPQKGEYTVVIDEASKR